MLKKLLTIAFVFQISKLDLYIEQPPQLKSQFSYQNRQGYLKYSVSTFGDIYYEQETDLKLTLPSTNNRDGCKPFPTLPNNKKERVVYLVSRGTCTYAKKAFNAQQSGAFTVLVSHNKPSIDVDNIIPVQDSTCFLKRQQFKNPDHSHFQRRWPQT